MLIISETVTVDKKVILDIIMELELLISFEIFEEAQKRDKEIAEGNYVFEAEISRFFEKKGIKLGNSSTRQYS